MKSLSISVLIFVSLILSKLHGLDVTGIVAFGDSLTCNGNTCLHAKKTATICYAYPKKIFQGRFTNGLVWLEVFADKLGLPRPTPSLAGGYNFAYGGATTGWAKSPNILNVGDQIEDYLKRTKDKAAPQNLFVLWAGGNDIKNEIIPTKLVSNLEQHITRLARAGAKTFLVPNFPPIAQTDVAAGALSYLGLGLGKMSKYLDLVDDADEVHKGFTSITGQAADFGIQALNQQLERMLGKLERSLKIKIYRLDIYTHSYAVKENLEAFGLRKEDLFIHDGFHPSAMVHALIAEEAYNACK